MKKKSEKITSFVYQIDKINKDERKYSLLSNLKSISKDINNLFIIVLLMLTTKKVKSKNHKD